jgi:hypothetical protein
MLHRAKTRNLQEEARQIERRSFYRNPMVHGPRIIEPIFALSGLIITLLHAYKSTTAGYQQISVLIIGFVVTGVTLYSLYLRIKGIARPDSYMSITNDEASTLFHAQRAGRTYASEINISSNPSWIEKEIDLMEDIYSDRKTPTRTYFIPKSQISVRLESYLVRLMRLGVRFKSVPFLSENTVNVMVMDVDSPVECEILAVERSDGISKNIYPLKARRLRQSDKGFAELYLACRLIDDSLSPGIAPKIGFIGCNGLGRTKLIRKLTDRLSMNYKIKIRQAKFTPRKQNSFCDNMSSLLEVNLDEFMSVRNASSGDVFLFGFTSLDALAFINIRSAMNGFFHDVSAEQASSIAKHLRPMVIDSYKEFDLVVHLRLDGHARLAKSNAVSSEERAALIVEIDQFIRDQHTLTYEIVFHEDPEAKHESERDRFINGILEQEVSRLSGLIEEIVAKKSVT